MGSIWSFLSAHLDLILSILKDVGYVGAGVGVIYGVFKWVASAFHTVRNTNANLTLLMENHLPHIQNAVDAQGESLRGIKSDVRDLDTKMTGHGQRLEDMKTAVHAVGESLSRHLENTSKENATVKVVRRKRAI